MKIDFQDGGYVGHLGFLIGRILAISDLQVAQILPTNFESTGFQFRRRSIKQILKTETMTAILDFRLE